MVKTTSYQPLEGDAFLISANSLMLSESLLIAFWKFLGLSMLLIFDLSSASVILDFE